MTFDCPLFVLLLQVLYLFINLPFFISDFFLFNDIVIINWIRKQLLVKNEIICLVAEELWERMPRFCKSLFGFF